jgi:hypothetical protein
MGVPTAIAPLSPRHGRAEKIESPPPVAPPRNAQRGIDGSAARRASFEQFELALYIQRESKSIG